jgi:tRNA (guanine-N7-)-methyltransferase
VRRFTGDVRDMFDVPVCQYFAGLRSIPAQDPPPRRFVTEEHLRRCASLAGGTLRVATDIEDYVRQTLEEVPALRINTERPADWREPWDDWSHPRGAESAARGALRTT